MALLIWGLTAVQQERKTENRAGWNKKQRGRSKSTFAQDSGILSLPTLLFALVRFRTIPPAPHSPLSTKKSVHFMDSASKNQKSSKVNMKPLSVMTFQVQIYWKDQKTERLKKMWRFFILKFSNKYTNYIIYNQCIFIAIHWQDWILSSFMMVCLIFHTAIIINRKIWRITI